MTQVMQARELARRLGNHRQYLPKRYLNIDSRITVEAHRFENLENETNKQAFFFFNQNSSNIKRALMVVTFRSVRV